MRDERWRFRDTTEFVLTQEHLTLLRMAQVRWQDVETGAPEIDPKRPYGNSDVAQDVAEWLGWVREREPLYDLDARRRDELTDRALALHRETELALQVVLETQSFSPGVYRRKDDWSAWERAE